MRRYSNLRIILDGGQSNGTNLQNIIDNIRVDGTIVPEPATVAGGLLGVLGLCWFQRRRLIRLCACVALSKGRPSVWGARASRVLVSASRRNNLSLGDAARHKL